MSRNLPVPLPPERPEVVVLDPPGAVATPGPRPLGALARLALHLTPDVIQALERSLAQRRPEAPRAAAVAQPDLRVVTDAIQYSEIEYDTRVPLMRKVTVRTATSWTTSAPALVPRADDLGGSRLRRAGAVGIGGAVALAALGLLANRGGLSLPGGRRGRR
jgi:hypothetical protein